MRAFLALLLLLPLPSLADDGTYGASLYGEPKYAGDFQHFDYVNPDAPKGGTVRLGAFGSFDTLNPFTLKGENAVGLTLVYETLMMQSADEPFSEYGLLAEKIFVFPDRTGVTFTLNSKAKFADGTPVKASDVVWTFNTLKTKGNPAYRSYYSEVTGAKADDEKRVTFTFQSGNNRELPLILGQLPVLPEHAWTKRKFEDTTLEKPLGSGPYAVKEFQTGRSIDYVRRKDYWGWDLPVMRGRYNFDAFHFDYYRDLTVMFEAFKAGSLDFWQEMIARQWATGYDVPAVKDGRIVKESIKHEEPQGMQGFFFNTRRDVFKDARVRHALAYAFDFAWTNSSMFFGQYTQTKSYFANSELASSGVPEGLELAALEPFRDKLPPALFTQPIDIPVTDGKGDIRENLKKAAALLKEAGWEIKKGVMTNAAGTPFTFEIVVAQDAFERVLLPFAKNLERLGITARLRRVDTAQYINRMNDFDFDMTVGSIRQSLSPGNEQLGFWGSAAADQPGSNNIAGIKKPVVDGLIAAIINAPSREELVARTRALDRVLLWGWYAIPNWHLSNHRVAYWNRFARPVVSPKQGVGFEDTWWLDAAKDAALKMPAAEAR